MPVKRVLVYSHISLWERQLAMTLELVLNLRSQGHEVYLVLCQSELYSCPANPHHDLSFCAKCRLHTKNLLETLLPKEVKTLKLMAGLKSAEKFQNTDFQNQSDFESLTYKSAPLGQLVLSQLVDDVSDLTIPEKILRTRGVELLNRAIGLFDWSVSTLQNLKIDEVYVWNGRRCSDGPVLHAASSLGIPKFCFISGATQDKIFTQPNSIHSLTEWRRSINSFCNSHSTKSLRELGNQFFAKQASQANPFFNSGLIHPSGYKPKMSIFSSTLWENFNLPEFKFLPSDFANPYQLIERICRDEKLLDRFEIIVRWHPNLVSAGLFERSEIRRVIEATPRVQHIPPESDISSYSLLEGSDLVVSTGSTIGVEATYLGLPSILLGTALYSGIGAVYEPSSYVEFQDLAARTIPAKSKDQALKYGAFMAEFGEELKFVNYDPISGIFSHANTAIFRRFSMFAKLIEFSKTICLNRFQHLNRHISGH